MDLEYVKSGEYLMSIMEDAFKKSTNRFRRTEISAEDIKDTKDATRDDVPPRHLGLPQRKPNPPLPIIRKEDEDESDELRRHVHSSNYLKSFKDFLSKNYVIHQISEIIPGRRILHKVIFKFHKDVVLNDLPVSYLHEMVLKGPESIEQLRDMRGNLCQFRTFIRNNVESYHFNPVICKDITYIATNLENFYKNVITLNALDASFEFMIDSNIPGDSSPPTLWFLTLPSVYSRSTLPSSYSSTLSSFPTM